MSFRFQKRVRVAPGVRLNISKRGISTSVGPRGASMTLGRNGLYGNVGIPGSGMSYRTKLNKKTGRKTIQMTDQQNTTSHQNVELVYERESNSVRFVTENGEPLPPTIERKLHKEFQADIKQMYEEKQHEINEQTTRLLDLHLQCFSPLSQVALEEKIDEITALEGDEPDENLVLEMTKKSKQNELSFFQKLLLLLPAKKEQFEASVKETAQQRYEQLRNEFVEETTAAQEENTFRKQLLEQVMLGDRESMEQWLEIHLPELDFPLETNVAFKALSKDTLYLDVDLPEMKDIPLAKAEILASGKLKVKEKTQRETREHYALVVGGTALYLSSFVFAYIPVCKRIIISAYTQVLNDATGHMEDHYIYSLIVTRDTFFSLNMNLVHPVSAFENFQPKLNVTKTYIFKEIEPYQPEDFIHESED